MNALPIFAIATALLLAGCADRAAETEPFHEAAMEVASGPHGGRLLEADGTIVELAIFESGVPPEFRAWIARRSEAIPPERVQLAVELRRLGGRVDRIEFVPVGDFLRGTSVVYEPHSFDVTVTAQVDGMQHVWEYASYEGRTVIAAEAAQAAGIRTAVAGPGKIIEAIRLYGVVNPDATRVRAIRARFPGVIRNVPRQIGDRVLAGDALATVESNDSLQTYTVSAPASGIITQRHAEPGEQTDADALFEIADYSTLWGEFNVFARDRSRVRVGQPVRITAEGGIETEGKIAYLSPTGDRLSQSVVARVVLDNADGRWTPGQFLEGMVTLAEHAAEVVVPASALQTFRDFDVVFAQVGDTYEVRMLELGRRDAERVEVLSGLLPGTVYVAENSYLIKADIEKSGASHDH